MLLSVNWCTCEYLHNVASLIMLYVNVVRNGYICTKNVTSIDLYRSNMKIVLGKVDTKIGRKIQLLLMKLLFSVSTN